MREPKYTHAGGTAKGDVFIESRVTEERHVRRGVEVGIGVPRFLDRSRRSKLSNKGAGIILTTLAGIAFATPWVNFPTDKGEKIEHLADDITNGNVHIGEITGRIPNVRLPLPSLRGSRLGLKHDLIRTDERIDDGTPTIRHKTEIIHGSKPTETVRLTEFGLGNFEGFVGQHDLSELDTVIDRLGAKNVTFVTINASASDESQKDLASGSCGIGVPNQENFTLAQQRADTVIRHLQERGIAIENIQQHSIGEHVLNQKVDELRNLLVNNQLTIQQACELYNNGRQDALPQDVRHFFDQELAANRYVEANFYAGEDRPEVSRETTSKCSIDSTVTEFVDTHTNPDISIKFDWNGSGLDLKGTTFGLPTILVLAEGILIFGRAGRRQRTISGLSVERQRVVRAASGDGYEPYSQAQTTYDRQPFRLPRIHPGIPIVVIALLGMGLALSQCKDAPLPTPQQDAPQEDTIDCSKTITRVVVDNNSGKVLSTELEGPIQVPVPRQDVVTVS